MNRTQTDRLAANVFVILGFLVLGAWIVALQPFWRGAFTSPEDVHVDDPAAAIRDAHALIAARNPAFLEPAALPPSLRIEGLRYAKVHRDHVDLVLGRNPDWETGAHIWRTPHRPHRDEPTRYPGIHFFRDTNDAPSSPENIDGYGR